MSRALRLAVLAAALLCASAAAASAKSCDRARMGPIVDAAIRPLMAEHDVPGMAVAVTIGGGSCVFAYGVASREDARPVDENTIFEIGSISKTFAATLGAYAVETGALSLSDPASRHWPALSGSSFDAITMLDLATYTAGGLPLQFPDDVSDEASIAAFYRNWRPDFPAGTRRLYSNPSIGLFGHLSARSLDAPFAELMETKLFPAFGLTRTYIRVPEERMGDYASGYAKSGKSVRVTPGALDAEAYGVKTTARDLIRFVEAEMDGAGLNDTWRRAIAETQVGRYAVGGMTQALGWELYAWPTRLETLLAGNAADVILKPNAVEKLDRPPAPDGDVLINKTGSTNGFGAYVAFAPKRRIGVVMLANRNFPIPARVTAARGIMTALDGMTN